MKTRYVAGYGCFHIVNERWTHIFNDGKPHIFCQAKLVTDKIIVGTPKKCPTCGVMPKKICQRCQNKLNKFGNEVDR